MANGYSYDIFVSYSRSGNVFGWVNNHFYPVLKDAMTDLLPGEPAIFLDTQQETGVNWLNNLAKALKRSRYLVAVWSAPYFSSRWCMAEWFTMVRREQLLGMGTEECPDTLVYPVIFANGDSFPPEAKAIQSKIDLRKWAYPQPKFKDTEPYLDFLDAMKKVADELVARLPKAPVWQPDWPVERPLPEPPTPPPLPRL